jgi:ribonuclease HI
MLISGLWITVELRIHPLEIWGDSELIVERVMKEKNYLIPKMAAYCHVMRELEEKFHRLELHHVLHEYNKATDILTKIASNQKPVPNVVFACDHHTPRIRFDEE